MALSFDDITEWHYGSIPYNGTFLRVSTEVLNMEVGKFLSFTEYLISQMIDKSFDLKNLKDIKKNLIAYSNWQLERGFYYYFCKTKMTLMQLECIIQGYKQLESVTQELTFNQFTLKNN